MRRGVRVVDGAALEKRQAKASRVRIPPSPHSNPKADNERSRNDRGPPRDGEPAEASEAGGTPARREGFGRFGSMRHTLLRWRGRLVRLRAQTWKVCERKLRGFESHPLR